MLLIGIPSPFFIICWPGYITLLFSLLTLTLRPSRCVIVLSNPKSDSSSVNGNSTYKLSPTLLNVLCFFYFIVKIRSPLYKSGTCSASLYMFTVSICFIPFSTLNYICLSSFTTRLPLQCSHLASIVFPLPLHFGHSVCIYICIPKPT